jgi:Undecaprenyl-phosphate glucose phosphotransferase
MSEASSGRLEFAGAHGGAAKRPVALSFPVVAGLVRVLDFAVLIVASLLCMAVMRRLSPGGIGGLFTGAYVAGALGTCWSLAREGAYEHPSLTSAARLLRLMIKPVILGTLCLAASIFAFYPRELPDRTWPVCWAVSATLLLTARTFPLAAVIGHWTRQGRLARSVAIIGLSALSDVFIRRLQEEPSAYRVAGLFDDRLSRVPPSQAGVPVRGTVADLLACSREERIDVIAIALPLSAVDRIRDIMEQLASSVADIVLTTSLDRLQPVPTSRTDAIGRNPVVVVRQAPMKDWRALQKAALDYGVGIPALLLGIPVLLLVALLIKLDSPGPVLFRQPRLGFNNRLFTCFKFRSMYVNATDLLADKQTTRDDPRVTRVGRVIRKYSIDELPQIFNVLNGTMSLVGPRPHAPNTKAADQLFQDVVKKYALRHRVKPGITGWAQVNGWRGETATVEQIEQRVACDLYYIENWSLSFDVKIMIMTVLREVVSKRAF